MKLSVIIVNYNVRYFLEQCLHSVMAAIRSLEAEVLVIDNNSTDGSISFLQPLFPSVQFIESGQNLGFGKANNEALAIAKGEYILFLNPDTLVPEDCFDKCIRFLESNPTTGALGVRMLDGSGRFLPESKRSFPSTSTAFYKLMGLSSLFPRSKKFNRYALGFLDEHINHSVEVLAGAFMMVRKSLLDTVGAFDEQFFMYGEDIDLSYRLKKAGFDNWYFAGTSIIHFKGESSKKDSANHVKMFYEAMVVFVQKHYQKNAGWLKAFLVAGIKLRSLFSLASRKSSPQRSLHTKTIVIGNDSEYAEVANIYRHNNREKNIIHHSPELKTSAATAVVFCQGQMPYSQIIQQMQEWGTSYSFRFHAAGSQSIVGSDSKSAVGEVLSI